MTFWDFNRSASGLAVLLKFAESKNLPADAMLKGTGLQQGRLMTPQSEMTAQQELKAAGNLIESLGNPAQTGFELGACYHLSSYGLWGYGLISSATVRDAVMLALKFLRLTYAFTLIGLSEEEGLSVLSFGEPEISPPLRQFMIARDMSAALLLMRELAGSWPAGMGMQVRMKMNRPASLPESMDFVSGASRNRLHLPKNLMNLTLPQANPVTVNMCEQLLTDLLARRDSNQTVASRVRTLLRVPGSSASDLASVADLLNLSERTLRRRLADEGVSYRDLTREVLSEWAIELLSDERRTISSVADQLGFADVSSFSQAFKRWTGRSPRSYRAIQA